jgi:hypothetical protein
MKKTPGYIFAILVIVITSLACGIDINPSAQGSLETRCNATASLEVVAAPTLDEINQFGTRLCEFKLTITNTSLTKRIAPVVNRYEEDIYQKTKTSQWLNFDSLEPGSARILPANIYTYTDPDATGVVMEIYDLIAGVVDTAECSNLMYDKDYYVNIAVSFDAGLCR